MCSELTDKITEVSHKDQNNDSVFLVLGLDQKIKKCAQRHIRPLYVNLWGVFFFFWFGSECGSAQPYLDLFNLI